ncbi:MAG: transcriptional regulator [Thermoplasmata archaeon]|nr:MAG: transcriptional regulator [Thermoplasmata archaeon]
MIEIITGSLEEQIIKFLQKTYPVTVEDIKQKLHLSKNTTTRVLQKLQMKNIVKLEPLPGKTYIRLLRNDFRFIGKKHQKKFIKHYENKKTQKNKEEHNSFMYS